MGTPRGRYKMIYLRNFSLITVFILLTCSCSTNTPSSSSKILSFFNASHPLTTFGSDSEIKVPGVYGYISNFIVDAPGNVYVSDYYHSTVDKFDPKGNFLFTYGRTAEISSKYLQWGDIMDTDATGNLIAYANGSKTFLVFSSNGSLTRTMIMPVPLIRHQVIKIKSLKPEELIMLTYSPDNSYQVLHFDISTMKYRVIYSDKKRIRPLFKDLPPDFDTDANGNCFITDTIDYKVYKYDLKNLSHGLSVVFSKEFKKVKIEERDMNMRIRPQMVRRLSGYENILARLKGQSGYFPAIFGINIDGNRVYLWTSAQDEEKHWLIDVYDLMEGKLVYRCTTSGYNEMGHNRVQIKDGKVYMLNIGSENREFKKNIGRFDLFAIPYKIQTYQVSL